MAVSTSQYSQQFLASDESVTVREMLEAMVADPAYNTQATYSPWQEDEVSFFDKHFTYLCMHPNVKPREYISNLRLMTKIKH